MFGSNQNFRPKSICWSKIKIFVQNQNFRRNSKFSSKNKNFNRDASVQFDPLNGFFRRRALCHFKAKEF